jgi:hypothetical protein
VRETGGLNAPGLHHFIAFMASANLNEKNPAFYPPRARWYSPVFYLGGVLRRRFWLDRIQASLPRDMTLAGTVASFLVPGLGIFLRGRKFWGLVALAGCGLLLLFFLVGFGYPIGNLAFGLVVAIHTSGFVFYCSPLMRQEELGTRLGFTLAALLAIGLLFYLPLRHFVLQRWAVPLRLNGRVFVVQRQFPVAAIRRGDWIAYQLGNDSGFWSASGGHGAIHVQSGLGLGPVLAVAGDRVGFSTNGFTVNGTLHPLLPHMPQSSEVSLQEKQWFIWPSYSISGAGNENQISSMMLQLALVPEKNFVGKIFPRWLGRRQITP